MLTENRKYHFVGELLLKRSHALDKKIQPKDDKVNWLFLNLGKKQFSFIYKIKNPLMAAYDVPFKVELAFTLIEEVSKTVKLQHTYEVLRGQEIIGTIYLIDYLDQ